MAKTILIGLFLGLVLFLTFAAISGVLQYCGRSRFQLLINEEKFNQFIETYFSSYESPAKDAGLNLLKIDTALTSEVKQDATSEVKHETFYIIRLIPSEEGLEVNKTLLKLELKEYLRNPRVDRNQVKIHLTKSYPKIRDFEVANARMKAYQILETPVKLEANPEPRRVQGYPAPYMVRGKLQSTWEVPQEEIVEWIEFVGKASLFLADNANLGGARGYPLYPPESAKSATTLAVSLNQEKIKSFIIPLAPEINQEPINAQLKIENGKVVAFCLSQEGKRLEIEESARRIQQALTSEVASCLTSEVELVVTTLTPEVTTESIDNLGITSLIGKGESNFAGSPRNRIHNIKVSTQKLSGTLIKPGEEFSFNKALGKVGPAGGYLPELVIKKDKVTPEFGGGVCQVSTTMFRAALFSGLPITERFPHAFPVAYYWPQGMDATVYSPHPDLKFKNDTPGHILIQKKIVGTKLTFELFGTDDKREIKIKGPFVLAKGKDGSLKTVLYREIYRDGELVKKDTFRSNYASPDKYPRE